MLVLSARAVPEDPGYAAADLREPIVVGRPGHDHQLADEDLQIRSSDVLSRVGVVVDEIGAARQEIGFKEAAAVIPGGEVNADRFRDVRVRRPVVARFVADTNVRVPGEARPVVQLLRINGEITSEERLLVEAGHDVGLESQRIARRADDENHSVTGVIERDIQVQGHQESRHSRIGRLHHLDADDLARSASGEQQTRNRPDQSTNALLSHG